MSALAIGFAIGYLTGIPLTLLLAYWYWEELKRKVAD